MAPLLLVTELVVGFQTEESDLNILRVPQTTRLTCKQPPL